MKTHRENGRRRGGFTLVELMVVIVIIGIMAGIVLTQFSGSTDDANVAKAKAEVKAIYDAISTYKLRCSAAGLNRDFPENLSELIEGPPGWDASTQGKWKPLLQAREVPKDPWGTEYKMEILSAENGEYEVRSFGKDKQPGGEPPYNKDIVFPAEKSNR